MVFWYSVVLCSQSQKDKSVGLFYSGMGFCRKRPNMGFFNCCTWIACREEYILHATIEIPPVPASLITVEHFIIAFGKK